MRLDPVSFGQLPPCGSGRAREYGSDLFCHEYKKGLHPPSTNISLQIAFWDTMSPPTGGRGRTLAKDHEIAVSKQAKIQFEICEH